MSVEYVALSFFKANKIDYYLNKPYIIFPCPHCCAEAIMLTEDATWKCGVCESKGTLVTLMRLLQNGNKEQKILQNIKVYNPTKEIQHIRDLFSKIIVRSDVEINILYEKVDKLIGYYNQTTEKGSFR